MFPVEFKKKPCRMSAVLIKDCVTMSNLGNGQTTVPHVCHSSAIRSINEDRIINIPTQGYQEEAEMLPDKEAGFDFSTSSLVPTLVQIRSG